MRIGPDRRSKRRLTFGRVIGASAMAAMLLIGASVTFYLVADTHQLSQVVSFSTLNERHFREAAQGTGNGLPAESTESAGEIAASDLALAMANESTHESTHDGTREGDMATGNTSMTNSEATSPALVGSQDGMQKLAEIAAAQDTPDTPITPATESDIVAARPELENLLDQPRPARGYAQSVAHGVTPEDEMLHGLAWNASHSDRMQTLASWPEVTIEIRSTRPRHTRNILTELGRTHRWLMPPATWNMFPPNAYVSQSAAVVEAAYMLDAADPTSNADVLLQTRHDELPILLDQLSSLDHNSPRILAGASIVEAAIDQTTPAEENRVIVRLIIRPLP